MRLASATHQGGYLMTRTTPAGESWRAWLNAKMPAKGWTRQSELIAAIAAAGADAARQTVSKWFKGENAADANLAVVVAEVLDADPLEALRAAGYGPVADVIGRRLGVASMPPEPLDEGIRLILGRKDRTPEQLADAVLMYERRKARLVAEMVRILDAMDTPDDRAESA